MPCMRTGAPQALLGASSLQEGGGAFPKHLAADVGQAVRHMLTSLLSIVLHVLVEKGAANPHSIRDLSRTVH